MIRRGKLELVDSEKAPCCLSQDLYLNNRL